MERAFLAETRSPTASGYDAQVDLQAMRDMRQVIESRLKAPSEYMAKGATDAIGIFTAPGQFPELASYPNGIPAYVDEMVNYANDPANHQQAVFWQHVQNAITAAAESVATPVASLPEATAWMTTPPPGSPAPSPGPNFYSLGDVGGNTFFGTRAIDHKTIKKHNTPKGSNIAVSALRSHKAEAHAAAAQKPMSPHDRLHHLLMKPNPQMPSIAPIPNQGGPKRAAQPPRTGTAHAPMLPGASSRAPGAAGLRGTSQSPGAAALPPGTAAGLPAAVTGYRAVIAAAKAEVAEARAAKEARWVAQRLPRQGGDLSSRSFAPIGAGGIARSSTFNTSPGENLDEQLAGGHYPSSGEASSLYPTPRTQPTDHERSAALADSQQSSSLPSPSDVGRALDNYFFRQSRLPPNGGAGFNPYLSPIWAGLKLPG